MRVMLTRPRADSERLAEALRTRGNDVIIEPMLQVIATGSPPPLDGVVALIATSANGLRAFAAASDRRDLAVYAVGDATALAAGPIGHASEPVGDWPAHHRTRHSLRRCLPLGRSPLSQQRDDDWQHLPNLLLHRCDAWTVMGHPAAGAGFTACRRQSQPYHYPPPASE